MLLDEQLYQDWLVQLQTWAADGRLVSASVDALRLQRGGSQQKLRRIAKRLAKGETRDLPPVELLPGSAMPGAAGAFAQATGTIYINQDWLQASNTREIVNVLTEEYGHYLDNKLNKTDTAGDEGAVFAEQLLGADNNSLASHINSHLLEEDDHGYIYINGQLLAAEFAAFHGTAGNDNITGTLATDYIYGYGGDDTLKGSDAIDIIDGGDGNDLIYERLANSKGTATGYNYGGDGDDTIYGGNAADIIRGDEEWLNSRGQASDNSGNDYLTGYDGGDLIFAGNGNDILNAGGGEDKVQGGRGADIIHLGTGSAEYIYQHDGDSVIWTDAGNLESSSTLLNNETITFGNGADVIYDWTHANHKLFLPNDSFNLLSSGDSLNNLTIGQNYFIQGSWSHSTLTIKKATTKPGITRDHSQQAKAPIRTKTTAILFYTTHKQLISSAPTTPTFLFSNLITAATSTQPYTPPTWPRGLTAMETPSAQACAIKEF